MTNIKLVFDAAVAAGIYTEEEAVDLLRRYGCLPLFTFAVWKKAGKAVKKGEHARLVVRIWQMKNGKNGKAAAEIDPDDLTEEERASSFYLKTCYLFDATQVEPLKVK